MMGDRSKIHNERGVLERIGKWEKMERPISAAAAAPCSFGFGIKTDFAIGSWPESGGLSGRNMGFYMLNEWVGANEFRAKRAAN